RRHEGLDPTVAEDDVGRAFAGDDVRVGDDEAGRDGEAGPVLLAPAGDALDLHRRADHAADGRRAEPGVQWRGGGCGRGPGGPRSGRARWRLAPSTRPMAWPRKAAPRNTPDAMRNRLDGW